MNAAATLPDTRDRLVIATPCAGGNVKLRYMNGLIRACTELAVDVSTGDGGMRRQPLVGGRMFLETESHIDRARNKLSNRFLLDTDLNWLLFIDADIAFDPAHVLALWQHGQRGHRIVAATYAQKRLRLQYTAVPHPGASVEADGLVQVDHAGTGFMLIHREVFAALADRGLAPNYRLGAHEGDAQRHPEYRAYFKSGVREQVAADGRTEAIWLSEDFMFCREVAQCGFRIMLDRRIALGHMGDLTYPPRVGELVDAVKALRAGAHPDLPAEPI